MNKKDKNRIEVRKAKRIDLRVTEDELSSIHALCNQAKITRSAYILQSVLNKKVLTHIDAQVVFQLRKVGNNINQITKQVHIISKFVDNKEKDLPEILKELSSMREQIEVISHYILTKDHAGKN